MKKQYLLSTYQLTGSPEEDVQHFFNVKESLKTYLAKADQQKTYIEPSLEQADKTNNFRAMVAKDLTVEHIRSAEASAYEINQRLGETQTKIDEGNQEIQRLKKQQIDNDLHYKKIIISGDEDDMKASEELAAEITQSLSRHELRLGGFGAVTTELRAKLNLYQDIVRAGRQSILRQNALASFERYKKSAEALAKQFDEVSAYMEVADHVIPSDQHLNPLAHLKRITLKPGQNLPEFRTLKQSLTDNIDSEINVAV